VLCGGRSGIEAEVA
jgi:hypothetical protein